MLTKNSYNNSNHKSSHKESNDKLENNILSFNNNIKNSLSPIKTINSNNTNGNLNSININEENH